MNLTKDTLDAFNTALGALSSSLDVLAPGASVKRLTAGQQEIFLCRSRSREIG